ncbi:MAG: hypothetical protein V4668_00920 [Patescibacteria group bacterium]
MIITSVIVTAFALIDSNQSTKEQLIIIAEENFINDKLAWVFSNATGVEIINPGIIKITRPDLETLSPLTLEFNENNLYFFRNLNDPSLINNPRLILTLESIEYVDSELLIYYRLNNMLFRHQAFIK